MPNGWTTAYGYAVNNAGLVDGNNTLVGATGIAFQAFIGTAAGSIAIPLPPGATIAYIQAGSINDSGFVVGTSDAGGWIWSASNGTVLLNPFMPTGWVVSGAISISNNGLILALASIGGANQWLN